MIKPLKSVAKNPVSIYNVRSLGDEEQQKQRQFIDKLLEIN